MRTITEFFGKSLKTIEETIPATREALVGEVTERLKSEGKSEEEIATVLDAEVQTALEAKVGEAHKMEGEKLSLFFNALQVASKAKGNLKRIVVMAPSKEGEKGPSGATEIDGKFFVVELFPDAHRAAPAQENSKDGRPGKRGKGRGGKGGRDRNREGRGGGERGPRKAAVPYQGPNRIIPVGSAAPVAAASAAPAVEAPSVEATPSAES